MTMNEPSDNPLASSKPACSWVWHSTEDSIATGQVSLVAVLETFLALALYGWLAFYFEHQWGLLISAVAAPIILLRSPESKALGVEWLTHYYSGVRVLDLRDLSFAKKSITIGLIVVIVLFIYWLIHWLAQLWLSGHQGWVFFWRANVLGAIAVAGVSIFAALGMLVGVGKVAFSIEDEVVPEKPKYLTAKEKEFLEDIEFYLDKNRKYRGVNLLFVMVPVMSSVIDAGSNNDKAMVIAAGIGAAMIAGTSVNPIAFADADDGVDAGVGAFAFGVWLRSLFIRTIATLWHPLIGIVHLPANWHETLWIVDFTHPPELLPGATQVSDLFSIGFYLRNIRTQAGKLRWTSVVVVALWYPPALLWRWSLKATLWLWWPLALVLRPPLEGKSIGEVRDIAATRVYGLEKWLALLALVVALWLVASYVPPEEVKSWAELMGDNVSKPLEKLRASFAPLPLGFRQLALWLSCFLTIRVWILSYHLEIQHEKVLKEDSALDEMKEDRQRLFLKRAHRLQRWCTARVASFILLGYAIALFLAYKWYPVETLRFIPAWLVGWL